MAKKVGELIKKARTDAGLTQEQLAKKVDGVTASDISKAERGEKELSQTALKQIAKATGVTQASLLDAAKSGGKTSTASGKKTSSGTSVKVTAAEKKLLELYRKADTDATAACTGSAARAARGGRNRHESRLSVRGKQLCSTSYATDRRS